MNVPTTQPTTASASPVVQVSFPIPASVYREAQPLVQQLLRLITDAEGGETICTPEAPPTEPARTTLDGAVGIESVSRADAEAMLSNIAPTSAPVEVPRRGRVPGLYRLVDGAKLETNPAIPYKPSELSIFHLLRSAPRGLTATTIGTRLGMSIGTVGWAVNELRKRKLLTRVVVKAPKTHRAPQRDEHVITH